MAPSEESRGEKKGLSEQGQEERKARVSDIGSVSTTSSSKDLQ